MRNENFQPSFKFCILPKNALFRGCSNCKHWESVSRNSNLSAAVLDVKPSRRNSNLYDSRENHHKVETLNNLVSLQYSKWNRDFMKVNLQKFSFRNLLTYMKNIHFSPSLEQPMETSRRNTASRHRNNVHVYDKWPVWG